MSDQPPRGRTLPPGWVDPVPEGEDAYEYLDTENNPAELTIALNRIAETMEREGWSYERCVFAFGIKGHPYFADFWPVTKYWGDARIAREHFKLPLD